MKGQFPSCMCLIFSVKYIHALASLHDQKIKTIPTICGSDDLATSYSKWDRKGLGEPLGYAIVICCGLVHIEVFNSRKLNFAACLDNAFRLMLKSRFSTLISILKGEQARFFAFLHLSWFIKITQAAHALRYIPFDSRYPALDGTMNEHVNGSFCYQNLFVIK